MHKSTFTPSAFDLFEESPGTLITHYRDKFKITLKEVADFMNISQSYAGKIEKALLEEDIHKFPDAQEKFCNAVYDLIWTKTMQSLISLRRISKSLNRKL